MAPDRNGYFNNAVCQDLLLSVIKSYNNDNFELSARPLSLKLTNYSGKQFETV